MPAAPEKKLRTGRKLLIVPAVVCAAAFVMSRLNDRMNFKQEILTPAVFSVDAGSLSSFPFDVYKPAHILGRFQATEESDNPSKPAVTMEAVIVDARDFENWKRGLPARVFYRSGETSKGRIDIRIPPGKYTLAFNNRSSPRSGERITANILLNESPR